MGLEDEFDDWCLLPFRGLTSLNAAHEKDKFRNRHRIHAGIMPQANHFFKASPDLDPDQDLDHNSLIIAWFISGSVATEMTLRRRATPLPRR
jgi:hypothetical protein